MHCIVFVYVLFLNVSLLTIVHIHYSALLVVVAMSYSVFYEMCVIITSLLDIIASKTLVTEECQQSERNRRRRQ